MKVREFIDLLSKPENQQMLDYDLGIELGEEEYYDIQNVYLSSLISRYDESESAHAVVVSSESLAEGKEEGGTGLFLLERKKIV